MFEIITGNIQESNTFQKAFLSRKQQRQKLKLPPIFDQYYPDVSELLKLMLLEDPKQRIKLDDALKHRVFERIDRCGLDAKLLNSPARSDISYLSPKNSVKTKASTSVMSNQDQISQFKPTVLEQEGKKMPVGRILSQNNTCITEFSDDEEEMIPDEDKQQANTSIRKLKFQSKGNLESIRWTEIFSNTEERVITDQFMPQTQENKDEENFQQMEMSLKSKISGGVKEGITFLKSKIANPIQGILKKSFIHRRNNTVNM